MTQRDTERLLWSILANHLRNQDLADLMAQAGWMPGTAPAKEVRRWARATDHVAGIVERRAQVRTRRPCLLAGQLALTAIANKEANR